MTRVAISKPRSTTTEIPDGLQIRIPSKKNWFVIAFLGFWLCGWAVGEVMVPTQLLKGAMPSSGLIFSIAWLGGWTVAGAATTTTFLWKLLGEEIITLSGDSLTVRRQIFGRGFSREYDLDAVKNLRVSPVAFNPWGGGFQFWWDGGFGPVTFDYGARTKRLGGGVDEAEAFQIVEALKAGVKK